MSEELEIEYEVTYHLYWLEHVLHHFVFLCLESCLHTIDHIVICFLLLLFQFLKLLKYFVPVESKLRLVTWESSKKEYLLFTFSSWFAYACKSRRKLLADLRFDFAPCLAHFFLLLHLIHCGYMALRYLVMILHAILKTLRWAIVYLLWRRLLKLIGLWRLDTTQSLLLHNLILWIQGHLAVRAF